MLGKLGIADTEQKIGSLSGGQRKRVALASALIHPADVLILDEPTNHLDSEAVTWLEDWLGRFRGGLLMVTHDRYFLERVVNRIAELSRGKLYLYEANYSRYLELKTEREEMAEATERRRQSILRVEREWIMLPACRMPVCYNGDLLSAADCAAFSARFPTVAAVMLGRGAAADPAIFSRVRGGSGADRETLRTFCAALFEGYCSAYGCAGNAVQRMKELWMNLFNLFADSARYEGKMRRASSPAEYRMLEAAVFRELRLLDEP